LIPVTFWGELNYETDIQSRIVVLMFMQDQSSTTVRDRKWKRMCGSRSQKKGNSRKWIQSDSEDMRTWRVDVDTDSNYDR
jgi:hypothetical protein